ncbi:MAG: hypothetical protein WBF33_33335 [Candidatus Nitrosopolaris sp.]
MMYDIDNIHPFSRFIIGNVLSVIAAIQVEALSVYSLNADVFGQFVVQVHKGIDFRKILEEMKACPGIYSLYQQLPKHFRITQWTSGSFDGLTLPKAEHLVKYMLSEEFENIMRELHEQQKKLTVIQLV